MSHGQTNWTAKPPILGLQYYPRSSATAPLDPDQQAAHSPIRAAHGVSGRKRGRCAQTDSPAWRTGSGAKAKRADARARRLRA